MLSQDDTLRYTQHGPETNIHWATITMIDSGFHRILNVSCRACHAGGVEVTVSGGTMPGPPVHKIVSILRSIMIKEAS